MVRHEDFLGGVDRFDPTMQHCRRRRQSAAKGGRTEVRGMTFGGRDGVGRAVVSLFTFGGRKKSGEIGRKKSDFWREILTRGK